MTLPIERARSRKPVTWLTLVGVLLLPVVIGGILIAALYNPTERLDAMSVAVVNDDEPVTINGQTAPLGRQLTAGLVEGSDEVPSNLTWTISNADDAAEGLADGTYNAVVTIPENFSAAATSTAPGSTPERATIEVSTSPDSLIVDDAITAQVTQAAAALMGRQLSEVYLENVFLGFTTLGDQLGEAADGAHQLADGAAQAADGAAQLPDGATQLASGASQLGDGATQIADGVGGLGDGATQLAGGLGTIAGKTREAAAGAQQIADGATGGAAQLRATGLVPAELSDVADRTATTAAAAASGTTQYLAGLKLLSDGCVASGAAPAYCDQLTAAVDVTDMQGAGGLVAATQGTQALAQGLQGGLTQFDTQATEQIAGQLDALGAGVGTLAGGLGQLAGGIDQSATGADRLADGAGQLQTGASGIATGATQLSDGATQLADGATQLSDGVAQVADGTGSLADGLSQAVDQVPSYTDAEATDLAGVVADPVAAEGIGSDFFGASAIPLLTMLALWFGGLASFVALQAVPRGALTSRRPSIALAARSLLPAAGIGAAQGALVAGIVQIAAGYDAGTWWVFAALCVVAGMVFAAVNQALVAVFGGAGRWLAALVGVLAVATGIVSTAPGVLASVAGLMPTTPAYNAMLAALTPATGVAAGLIGMIVWGALAFVVTVIAVARRRTTSAAALLKASPALA
ncbi:YhgE/Pip family protein [Microbacterium sp. W1N]|uniref:YhgE/Pip family protein n=1 Tax=Microbacterium festucae TaxID=2977531 RepID=UPI0021BEA42B|nr:YhgE/Pip family protein [Microbacterium festucae]MCT9820742.1 YhgE/Pip family protein [Microbacterium festucae]